MSTNFKQSVSGYIRQNLASIESKISVGIRHESIIEEINSNGFNIDIGTFRTCLYRARKSSTSKKNDTPVLINENEDLLTTANTESTELDSPVSHHPSDIDAIINRKSTPKILKGFIKGKK